MLKNKNRFHGDDLKGFIHFFVIVISIKADQKNSMDLIAFKPLYKERVWGGRGLEEKLSRSLPDGKVIGESWEIVDRPEAQSIIANGPHAGLSIRELLEEQAEAILGRELTANGPSLFSSSGSTARIGLVYRCTLPQKLPPRWAASQRRKTGTLHNATKAPRLSSASSTARLESSLKPP